MMMISPPLHQTLTRCAKSGWKHFGNLRQTVRFRQNTPEHETQRDNNNNNNEDDVWWWCVALDRLERSTKAHHTARPHTMQPCADRDCRAQRCQQLHHHQPHVHRWATSELRRRRIARTEARGLRRFFFFWSVWTEPEPRPPDRPTDWVMCVYLFHGGERDDKHSVSACRCKVRWGTSVCPLETCNKFGGG